MALDRTIRPDPTEPTRRPLTTVRVHRIVRGISQRELSRRTGLARETVARIERGRGSPTIATAQRIADQLGVSIAVLFGRHADDRMAALEALRHVGYKGDAASNALADRLQREFDAVELCDADLAHYRDVEDARPRTGR
jgi:transcriptional regulator with XRE-family HTH domain